jgi:hypothetical protein
VDGFDVAVGQNPRHFQANCIRPDINGRDNGGRRCFHLKRSHYALVVQILPAATSVESTRRFRLDGLTKSFAVGAGLPQLRVNMPGRMVFKRLCLALAWLALWPCWALAADVRSADRPLVILTETGHADSEDEAFFGSLRAHAGELGMATGTRDVESLSSVREALVREAQKTAKPFLVAWVLRDGDVRKLHLFDPWTNQLRTREIDNSGSPAANAENLALILRAELIAYLSEPPPPPPPSPPSPPPAPPPAPPPPETRVFADAAFAAGTFLRGWDPWLGARLAIAYRWGFVRWGAGYTLLPGHSLGNEATDFELRRHPSDLFLAIASSEGALRFVGGVAFSVDVVRRHTALATAPLSRTRDESRLLYAVAAKGRVELRLGRGFSLYLGAGAEVPLNPFDFRLTRGDTVTTLARMAPLRGLTELGLSGSFL